MLLVIWLFGRLNLHRDDRRVGDPAEFLGRTAENESCGIRVLFGPPAGLFVEYLTTTALNSSGVWAVPAAGFRPTVPNTNRERPKDEPLITLLRLSEMATPSKTAPADDSVRQLHTDPNIESYQGYIPDDWGPTHIAPLPMGTVLERLLLNLAVLWRTASYTAQMPANAIKASHAAALGRGKHVTTDRSIVAYTDDILRQLSDRMSRLARDPALAARIRKALKEIATEKRDRLKEIKDDFPIEHIWADFMTQDAFRLSLWESQRIAYLAFYNAYEAFVVECLKVGTCRSSLRATDRDFKDVLRTGLPEDISDPCWFHGEIHFAREVRNALSHNGGRESAALKKLPRKIKVIDEVLQIVPADIHRMLGRIRLAVETIIAATKDHPKFLAPAVTLPPPEEGD